jgi:hypothetical protein
MNIPLRAIMGLRRDLEGLRRGLHNLCDVIQDYIRAIHTQSEHENNETPVAPPAVVKVGFDENTVADSKRENERQHRTQKQIRNATRAAVGAAIIYAGVAAYQARQMEIATRAAQRSAIAAQQAADASGRELELSERPWIDADISVAGALTFDPNGAVIPLKIILRNSGHSPGLHIGVDAITLVGYREKRGTYYREQACQQARGTGLLGPDLFPSRVVEERLTVGIGYEQNKKANLDWKKRYPSAKSSDRNIIAPELVVCVSYQPTFKEKTFYETTYAMDLSKVRPGFFKIGQAVDAKDIRLTLDPMVPPIAN